MQLPPPKDKACVSAFSHFHWKFKKIPFKQSLLIPDMETSKKLVAQPTGHSSLQKNLSFSELLGLVLVNSPRIHTASKEILNRLTFSRDLL